MIMKANKQIGFIYKDNESIDKILKDGDVVFERGFLREKTSTTLPINFDGVGKDLKDYKIYGNTKQQILPSGYTQVDYIESDTNSYIDMGLKGNQNTKIVTSALFKNGGTFVGDIADSLQAISLRFFPNSSVSISRFGDQSITGIFKTYSLNRKYLIEISSSGIKVDNNIIHQWQNITPFETAMNLYLFKNATASESILMCLYSCKIYDNNILVRDFIPCYRNSDNEIGLYDLVNKVFYTNQGTGVFTYGNVAPTPDTPIEMVSCGDKTSNLFSSKMELGTINDSGQNANSENAIRTKDYIEVNPNTTYTMSNDKNYRIFLYQYDENNDYVTHSNNYGGYITFTTASNTKYVKARTNAGTIENDLTSLWKLAEGSTVTPYEPYGYKIPVNVRSDNLCNITSLTGYQYNSQIPTTPNNNFVINNFDSNNLSYSITNNGYELGLSNVIKLKPNTIYTMSCIRNSTENSPRIYIYNYVNNTYTLNIRILGRGNLTFDFTTDETGNIVLGFAVGSNSNGASGTISNIQIVEGSTAPSKYIPYYNETTNIYLDEPLRKIDGYSDYIDFINGKVVRNIKEIVLNGTENNPNINTSQTNTVRLLYSNLLVNNKSIANNPNVISNYLIGKIMWAEDSQGIYTNTNDMVIRINKSIIGTTINEINAWITKHNIEACYPLSTPTEESITLPNIPTINGNNTLNIETEITPSQVYIKYKSNT